MIFKLAEKFARKYAVDQNDVDHYGVDPDTGLPIQPKFENGDLVEYLNKPAVYLTKAYWSGPDKAIIQFLHKKVPTTSEIYSGALTYAPESMLKLLKKKSERDEFSELEPKAASKKI
jgi:hypothetical protein